MKIVYDQIWSEFCYKVNGEILDRVNREGVWDVVYDQVEDRLIEKVGDTILQVIRWKAQGG